MTRRARSGPRRSDPAMLKVVSLVPLGSAAREEIESIHPSIELHMATVETKNRPSGPSNLAITCPHGSVRVSWTRS